MVLKRYYVRAPNYSPLFIHACISIFGRHISQASHQSDKQILSILECSYIPIDILSDTLKNPKYHQFFDQGLIGVNFLCFFFLQDKTFFATNTANMLTNLQRIFRWKYTFFLKRKPDKRNMSSTKSSVSLLVYTISEIKKCQCWHPLGNCHYHAIQRTIWLWGIFVFLIKDTNPNHPLSL